jgi:phage anti-repressor protein
MLFHVVPHTKKLVEAKTLFALLNKPTNFHPLTAVPVKTMEANVAVMSTQLVTTKEYLADQDTMLMTTMAKHVKVV